MKKAIIGFVVAVLAISASSFAATKEELAKQVIMLTDVHKMTDQVMAQVQQMQVSQLKTVNVPKEKATEAAAHQERIKKKLTDSVSWDKLESEYAAFLVNTYTEDELKAILSFYKSPVGQGILQKEPIMMGKIMVMMQNRIQAVMPEVQKMNRDFVQSMKLNKIVPAAKPDK